MDDEDRAWPSRARPTSATTCDPVEEEELPVVARMVVEIRSDGTRVVARGALDDRTSGQRVAVELTPTSPWAMAKTLAKLVLSSSWRRGIARRRRLRGSE